MKNIFIIANNLCQNISPSKDNWIGIGIGLSGVSVNIVVSQNYARTEVYINRGTQKENKEVFDLIAKYKTEIETELNEKLVWQRMDENVTSRIKWQMDNVSVYDQDDWLKMTPFLIKSTEKMEKVFRGIVKKLKTHLSKKE